MLKRLVSIMAAVAMITAGFLPAEAHSFGKDTRQILASASNISALKSQKLTSSAARNVVLTSAKVKQNPGRTFFIFEVKDAGRLKPSQKVFYSVRFEVERADGPAVAVKLQSTFTAKTKHVQGVTEKRKISQLRTTRSRKNNRIMLSVPTTQLPPGLTVVEKAPAGAKATMLKNNGARAVTKARFPAMVFRYPQAS